MSCYKYWEKILKISESLTKYDKNKIKDRSLNEILPLLDAIEEIAHDQKIDFKDAEHILKNEKMNDALKIIRGFYVEIGLKLETENAQEILESENPWKTLKSFYFYERYEKLIQNENKLINFIHKEVVVFIGGGPLPLTLILLNKMFGVKGISIEIVPDIAEISRKVLKKLDLTSEIIVISGDETELSYLDYNVVMVAALAEPKKRIFNNVKKEIKQYNSVIYRTYTGMRAILYSPVTEEATQGFQEINRVLPPGKVNNTSILIHRIN
ncbi:MAG: nicotianamine synthase family protein [Methanobacterium sp.]